MTTLRPPEDSKYREWYEKGWRYSGTENANLDYVPRGISDQSPEYDHWLDGYLDRAVGRDKWHLAYCENHTGSTATEGCRQA